MQINLYMAGRVASHFGTIYRDPATGAEPPIPKPMRDAYYKGEIRGAAAVKDPASEKALSSSSGSPISTAAALTVGIVLGMVLSKTGVVDKVLNAVGLAKRA